MQQPSQPGWGAKIASKAVTSRRDFLRASTAAAGVAVAAPWATAEDRPERPPAKHRAAKAKLDLSRGCPAEIRSIFTGPWPSIRTPFTKDGRIDDAALRGQLDFAIEAKGKAVVLTWGDSLFSLLTDDEIAQVAKTVVEHVNHRAFVVAATDRWWTGKAAAFAAYCADLGADMVMGLPPDWAASTTVDMLVPYYGALAEHLPVMIVTNYLGSRGTPFALDLCRRLLKEVPGVIALKDDLCNDTAQRICLLARDRWALSAGGQKKNHMLLLPYGVDGYLSTFITFKPEIAWRYWDAVQADDLDAAANVIRDFDIPFFDHILGYEGGFDAAIHGIDEIRGRGRRYRRPPYHSLSDRQLDELAGFLKSHWML